MSNLSHKICTAIQLVCTVINAAQGHWLGAAWCAAWVAFGLYCIRSNEAAKNARA